MQQMNNFIDAVNSFISKGDPEPLYSLHSPLKLQFVYQQNQGTRSCCLILIYIFLEFKLITTSFFMPMNLLTKRYEAAVPQVVLFYDNCAKQLMSDLSKMEGKQSKGRRR
jgi:hypothetical protein